MNIDKDSFRLSTNQLIIKENFIYIQNYLRLPEFFRKQIRRILKDYKINFEFLGKDKEIYFPKFVLNLKERKFENIAPILSSLFKAFYFQKLVLENFLWRRYSQKIDFKEINNRAIKFSNFIERNKEKIIKVLLKYETYEVAIDEIGRTLDLLRSLSENKEYFKRKVGTIVAFLPRNQPLYALSCFAIVPSLMAKKVNVRIPPSMRFFFPSLVKALDLSSYFPNVYISRESRNKFLKKFSGLKFDKKAKRYIPITDVVIFTGKSETAAKIRKIFPTSTLFIANGSGHNPVVITETADIDKAVFSVLRLQLYNQGQDCSAPNAILVHKKVYNQFIKKLKEKLKEVKIGPYKDRENRIGPYQGDKKELERIFKFLLENKKWIAKSTPGIIRVKSSIIEPVLILKPLKEGGNYTEQFAPIFVVQKYEKDEDLFLYFEKPDYFRNAMYITLFGSSSYINNLVNRTFPNGRILHPPSTIIKNTDLHAPGVERGVKPYGGYGKEASSISIYGRIISKPTLPQRDIYYFLVRPAIYMEKISSKKIFDLMEKYWTKRDKEIYNIFSPLFENPLEDKIIRNMTKSKRRSNNISNLSSNRLTFLEVNSAKRHWGEILAEKVLKEFPNEKVYVVAAGITPSGIIHFGNFRDIVTSFAVAKALKNKRKKVRFIFSWDDFDHFRKVPQNVSSSFKKYLGMPLTKVPDPTGKYSSYAEHFEKEFEKELKELKLGIEIEYLYQTKEYKSGRYDNFILEALNHRLEIAEILLSFMSEKAKREKKIDPKEFKKEYFPILVYSRFTNKNNTKILRYDGGVKITYKCLDTGKVDIVDITKERIVKLRWKVDWPMRWKVENVVFEPGGYDHAAPGSSYNVGSVISQRIFNKKPPVFIGYQFVGIQGICGKMSSSKGKVISLSQLLKIYEPPLLKWLYLKRSPEQGFNLTFDTTIYRYYDEFDREVDEWRKKKLSSPRKFTIENSFLNIRKESYKNPLPFRQAVSFGQIIQWKVSKIKRIFKRIKFNYDERSITSRLKKARVWLEEYNPQSLIKVRRGINKSYASKMSISAIENVRRFRKTIWKASSIEDIEKAMYEIPKDPSLSSSENKIRQRKFFKDVYNLLISSDSGPRLSTLIWVLGKKKVSKLLNI